MERTQTKKINISKYEEIEKMTEEQAQANACRSGKIKEVYNYYILDTIGYFGHCLVVYSNSRQIHNNTQLHYRHIKNSKIIDKLIEVANEKIFTPFEILKPCRSYAEYSNLIDFVMHYYIKQYNYVSSFSLADFSKKTQEEIKNNWIKSPLTWGYFKTQRALDDYTCYLTTAQENHKKQLATNKAYFEDAIAYEFANYECSIGGRFIEALAGAEIDTANLKDWQREIINQQVKKCWY